MKIRKVFKQAGRLVRETRMFARAMQSASHPICAQIVPIRRCNLDCAYCNEYDKVSSPVPIETMLRRIDRLADLGTTIITLSGGEPTLHPDLDAIIQRIRQRGAIATLITNGLLLTRDRIQRLNRAGLDYLQISIDNVLPDEISKKSLKVLDLKLQWLAEYAEFSVTINSVLGAGIRNPEDAFLVGQRARELSFTSTVGILHDHTGQLKPLAPDHQRVYERFRRLKDIAILVYSFRQLPGKYQPRPPQRLALSRRRTLPLHLRRGPCALLFATAGPARHSAGGLWG